MASKFSATLTAIGFGMVVLSKSLYLVDPGEKALIMNNLSGLKQKIYHQGYHLMIPFLEVNAC
jgi:prohibitin 2